VWKWTLEPEKASTGLDWMGRNIVKRKASTRWQDKKNMDLGIGIGIGGKNGASRRKMEKPPSLLFVLLTVKCLFLFFS
jgi:hypothetical protein